MYLRVQCSKIRMSSITLSFINNHKYFANPGKLVIKNSKQHKFLQKRPRPITIKAKRNSTVLSKRIYHLILQKITVVFNFNVQICPLANDQPYIPLLSEVLFQISFNMKFKKSKVPKIYPSKRLSSI